MTNALILLGMMLAVTWTVVLLDWWGRRRTR
jgi:hypothetical protein